MILEQCKGVHCEDFGESFPTSIYLQNFVSIQPLERALPSLPHQAPRDEVTASLMAKIAAAQDGSAADREKAVTGLIVGVKMLQDKVAWRSSSSAYGMRLRDAANFRGLVLGCIAMNFCK